MITVTSTVTSASVSSTPSKLTGNAQGLVVAIGVGIPIALAVGVGIGIYVTARRLHAVGHASTLMREAGSRSEGQNLAMPARRTSPVELEAG